MKTVLSEPMRYSSSPFAGLPVVVKNLLILNVIIYLVKVSGLGDFGGTSMDTWFGLHYFSSPLFRPWQLVTHMFMHGGFGSTVCCAATCASTPRSPARSCCA